MEEDACDATEHDNDANYLREDAHEGVKKEGANSDGMSGLTRS